MVGRCFRYALILPENVGSSGQLVTVDRTRQKPKVPGAQVLDLQDQDFVETWGRNIFGCFNVGRQFISYDLSRSQIKIESMIVNDSFMRTNNVFPKPISARVIKRFTDFVLFSKRF